MFLEKTYYMDQQEILRTSVKKIEGSCLVIAK